MNAGLFFVSSVCYTIDYFMKGTSSPVLNSSIMVCECACTKKKRSACAFVREPVFHALCSLDKAQKKPFMQSPLSGPSSSQSSHSVIVEIAVVH